MNCPGRAAFDFGLRMSDEGFRWFFMGGPVLQALQFALDGLTLQQQVQANNIANLNTPNFTASRVDFATSLTQALNEGSGTATAAVAPSQLAASTNGNNVSISQELVGAEQSATWYQAVTSEINNQYHLVRGSAGGSF